MEFIYENKYLTNVYLFIIITSFFRSGTGLAFHVTRKKVVQRCQNFGGELISSNLEITQPL